MDQEEDGIRRRKEEEKPISLEAILAIEKAVQDVKQRLEEQSGQDSNSVGLGRSLRVRISVELLGNADTSSWDHTWSSSSPHSSEGRALVGPKGSKVLQLLVIGQSLSAPPTSPG